MESEAQNFETLFDYPNNDRTRAWSEPVPAEGVVEFFDPLHQFGAWSKGIKLIIITLLRIIGCHFSFFCK